MFIELICIFRLESLSFNSNVNMGLGGGIIREKMLFGILVWVNG